MGALLDADEVRRASEEILRRVVEWGGAIGDMNWDTAEFTPWPAPHGG